MQRTLLSPRQHKMNPTQRQARGFTLIELLIVVAIIAMLALIALVNMETATIRSKVARSKSDLRTLSTAIECYRSDTNTYPQLSNILRVLSTPVRYLTTPGIRDPFLRYNIHSTDVSLLYYGYGLFDDPAFKSQILDPVFRNPRVTEAFGSHRYLLSGRGPDGDLETMDPTANYLFTTTGIVSGLQRMANGNFLYDPTNGTNSDGDLARSQGGEVTAAFVR